MNTLKNTATFLSALLFSVSLYASQEKNSSYEVNLEKSEVKWHATKKIGSFHEGLIKIKSGKLELNKDLTPLSGEVIVDMASITNTDLKDAGMNKKLVDHLKSDDFFGVSKDPTSKLVIKKASKETNAHKIEADLTIKGQTQSLVLAASIIEDKPDHKVIKTSFTFDRTKFNVKFNSEKFFKNLGDKIINDTVEVSVLLYITKK